MITIEHNGIDENGDEVIEKITNVRNIFFGIHNIQIIQMRDGKPTPIEKPIRWLTEIYMEGE